MSNNDGLTRLGRAVEADRVRTFGTVQRAIRAAEVNAATWKRVEDGLPVRADRLGAITEALGWPAGRAGRILDGIELETEPMTFREYVTRAALPESFKADVLRLVAAYESEQGARSA